MLDLAGLPAGAAGLQSAGGRAAAGAVTGQVQHAPAALAGCCRLPQAPHRPVRPWCELSLLTGQAFLSGLCPTAKRFVGNLQALRHPAYQASLSLAVIILQCIDCFRPCCSLLWLW